ncbi:MAG: hypothetical protein JSV56_13055 [Methanomassiliicoccales archaeon]|nr:MAG: hypothetical protein JSV56_13055 [Methanomassiliicoccales archaeon]
MKIKSVEEIIAEIKECYDQEPEGWKLLRGRDRAGHYDTYIMNKKNLWQMKTEFKTPFQPKGVGIRIMDKPDEEVEVLMEKGTALPFGEIYQQRKNHPIFALGIGRYSPKATSEMKGILSSKQEELEKNLSENLDKLLFREGIYKEYL